MDAAALDWVPGHPAADRLSWVTGSAADERVAETAAERAEAAAPLAGWVNNAALFRDAALHTAEPAAIMDLISANLAPVVTGCAVAVRRFLAAGRGCRLRARTDPGQRCGARLHRHRAVPGAARGPGRASRGADRTPDGRAAPARPGRPNRGGRRRGGVPAVQAGQLHHRGRHPGGRRAGRPRARPRAAVRVAR